MGLDTTHNCWHGPYSAFARWRNAVAGAAGYAWGQLNGMPTILIDWGHITDANLNGVWDSVPSDPLIYLIAHQDCEGVIAPAQAATLADRLEQLLPLLKDEGYDRTKERTQAFIDGLRLAVAANENVEFH